MAQIELTEREKKYLEEWQTKFGRAEKEQGFWTSRWNRYHGLYHSYRDWRSDRNFGQDPDVDTRNFTGQAQRDWGAQLFIPLTFGLIETIVPRLVANDPTMTIRPPRPGREGDVEPVKILLERQQEQMDFQLKLQDVGKSGLMYGLGVMKTFWRKEYRYNRALEKSILPTQESQYVVSDKKLRLVYDDPDCEPVDIWDFFWDPYGYDLRTCGYIIHRTWRSRDYCLGMAKAGIWRQDLTADDLTNEATNKYSDTWADRMKVQGFGQRDIQGGDIQEVWECHDGNRVCTILNRKLPVQEGENPNWHGDYPFQIYRPNRNLHQLVGKGEIEPVQDLQEEMNTMRSQRRDAATFSLMPPLFYTEGLVDPADLKVGPGVASPVTGDPKDVLWQAQLRDLPASSYQEEAALKQDFDYTSGISDPVVGASSGDGTATEAQMVFQAASERIKLKTKRLSREVVKQVARQIIALDQQRIIDEPREVVVQQPPEPGSAEQRWKWYEIGPDQLHGFRDLEPDDLSMIPENVAQERADGQQLWMIGSQSPAFDQRRLAETVCRKFGVDPEQLLAPDEPRVPPVILDLLAEAGVPQDLIAEAWQAAEQAEQTGQRPNWPPDEVVQAHEDVAQEDMNRAVQDAMPAEPASANGSSSSSSKASA